MMQFYDIRIEVDELKDGGDYQYIGTRPDLPGLLVAGDSPDEVLALAPDVASALIASLRHAGQTRFLGETWFVRRALPRTRIA